MAEQGRWGRGFFFSGVAIEVGIRAGLMRQLTDEEHEAWPEACAYYMGWPVYESKRIPS